MKWWRDTRDALTRRTPNVPQLSALDCGPAALATILKNYGIEAAYFDLLNEAGTSRDGTSISGLLNAARSHGLDATARRCTALEALTAPYPSIAFWGGGHFVVLEGVVGNRIAINDPQSGRRLVSKPEFGNLFAGRLIEFAPLKETVSAHWSRSWHWGRPSRIVAFTVVLSLMGIALGLIGWIQPKPGPIDPSLVIMRNGLIVAFAGFIALAVLGITLPKEVSESSDASRRTAVFPLNTLQLMPSGFFLPKLRETRLRSFIGWIACGLIMPVAVVGLVQGRLPWILVILIALLLAWMKILAQQRHLAQTAIASTGLLRLRAQFTELITKTDELRLLLRNKAFTSAFCDWQKRRFREVQQLSNLQMIKCACLGLVGALAIAVSMISDQANVYVGWLGLSSFSLLAASVLVFIGQSSQIDPTRQRAIAQTIGTNSFRYGHQEPTEVKKPKDTGLQMRDVTFGFDPNAPPILSGLSLSLALRDIVAVTGPKASGKTSLARLAADQYLPNKGYVTFRTSSKQPAGVSYLSEDSVLSGSLEDIPDDLIEEFKVAEILDRGWSRPPELYEFMATISRGERQRLSIAYCLSQEPDLLVLDNAMTCIAPADIAQIIQTLRKRGVTCLILSNQWPLLRLCDRVELLNQGRLKSLGAPKEYLSYDALLTELFGTNT
ncbi:cysteine peptidase family C39 domain-containing protein [Ruegeria sp. A3M17]|uniref:cysteine peptidase family C39 domain-containing protein n=1 Tax=Ruegeria sp. A3M17 TaxID=2267229 RepID=UPI001314416C|nr:cysteine peptidase family C39 domain-containing protein [Ruegeria sp. A3M17]